MERKALPLNTFAFLVAFFLFLILIVSTVQTVFSAETSTLAQANEMVKPGSDFDSTKILVKYKTRIDNDDSNRPDSRTSFNSEYKPIYIVSSSEKSTGDATSKQTPPTMPKQASSEKERDLVRDTLIKYLRDPNVESAQPNYMYTNSAWTVTSTTSTPQDYNPTNDWYYTNSKLPEMWYDKGCAENNPACASPSGVTVAVIDTGLAFEQYDDTGDYSYYNEIGFPGGKNLQQSQQIIRELVLTYMLTLKKYLITEKMTIVMELLMIIMVQTCMLPTIFLRG